MDAFVYIKEQVRQRLLKANLCSKHVKDASSFILTLGEHAESIGKLWLELFQTAENPASQLALLYVANEILIKCSKYGVPEFKDVFRPFVTEAVKQHLRPGHLVPKLSKLFNYWLRYKLFEPHFVQQLLDGLGQSGHSGKKRVAAEPLEVLEDVAKDFHPENLTDSLRKLKQTEDELQDQLKPDIQHLYVNLPIPNIVSSLKSKEESRVLSRQVELSCKNLDLYIKRRTEYLEQLNAITRLVELAEQFYETQHKEVSVVVNAYSTYGKRVSKTLEQARACVGINSPKTSSISDGTSGRPYEVSPSPKPNTTPQGVDEDKFDDFADDFANDDDSDFESGPTLSVNNVVYHPSPIQPLLKETEPLDKTPAKAEPARVEEEPVPTNTMNITPTKPEFGGPFGIGPIQDASGDVDYRPLLDPTFKTRFQSGAKTTPTSESLKTASPVITTPTQQPTAADPVHQLSTSVCHDEDGDSMEMSEDDEPADEVVNPTPSVLEAGPLDPSAMDTGDRDWRLLTQPITKPESIKPVRPSVEQPLPSPVPQTAPLQTDYPWCSRFPQSPAYFPGPMPQPPSPFSLAPTIPIPPPPPPPQFVGPSPTGQHSPVSAVQRFTNPPLSEPRLPPPPPPPPPPVSLNTPPIVQCPPGSRLPGGVVPSFPRLSTDQSLPFPRPVTTTPLVLSHQHIPAVSPAEPSPVVSEPVEPKVDRYSPVSMFGSSDHDDRVLPVTSEHTIPVKPQEALDLKPVAQPASILAALTRHSESIVQNSTAAEDPFAVISRLTGLSNLVKGLQSAKTDANPPVSSTVNQAVPQYIPSIAKEPTPQPAAPSDCDMRHANQPEPPMTMQRLLETFVLRRSEQLATATSLPQSDSKSESKMTAPDKKQTESTSESNSPYDVEVIESLTQSIHEEDAGSSPSGGETPTQDEHGENHADASLPVGLASLLLPKSNAGPVTGPSLFTLPGTSNSPSLPQSLQSNSNSVMVSSTSHDAAKVPMASISPSSVRPSNPPMTLPNNLFSPPGGWNRPPVIGAPGSLTFPHLSVTSVSPPRIPLPTASSNFDPVVSGAAQQLYLFQSSQQQHQINSMTAGMIPGAPGLWPRFTSPLLPPSSFASFLPTGQPPNLLQLFTRGTRPPNP